MNLHEYQAKTIFSRFGLPIPNGRVARSPAEAAEIASDLGGSVVVKAQVRIGGRGKAGGIRVAHSPEEASQLTEQIMGMEIKGLPVRLVLVEQAVDIAQEIYLSYALDRTASQLVLIASAEGGIDIEEVAASSPEKIVRVAVDPLLGMYPFMAREAASGIELERSLIAPFSSVCENLYRIMVGSDATLAEINPLVITSAGMFLALDAKVIIDDNALFRQPILSEIAEELKLEQDLAERDAVAQNLSYVKLDGYIGCLVNGAGLAMATMDLTKLYGGAPANFLDIGGGARSDRVAAALRIILSDPHVRCVLINIFGGITRCDEVAMGILEAIETVRPQVPMVVRLVGTNEEAARGILSQASLITATTMAEAARLAVEAAGSR